jgi:hypothetical protein
MIDNYSKAVLTVIAIALTTIAWRGVQPNDANATQASLVCKQTQPCFVVTMGSVAGTPPVRVSIHSAGSN